MIPYHTCNLRSNLATYTTYRAFKNVECIKGGGERISCVYNCFWVHYLLLFVYVCMNVWMGHSSLNFLRRRMNNQFFDATNATQATSWASYNRCNIAYIYIPLCIKDIDMCGLMTPHVVKTNLRSYLMQKQQMHQYVSLCCHQWWLR